MSLLLCLTLFQSKLFSRNLVKFYLRFIKGGKGGWGHFLKYLISGADVRNEWSYASTPRLFLQGEDMNNLNIFYLLSNQLILDQP